MAKAKKESMNPIVGMPVISKKPSVRISMDDPRGMNSMSVSTDKMCQEDMKTLQEIMGRCVQGGANKGKNK